MNEWQAMLIMVGLFALRCILPVLVTIGLGYLMNRLVDRWEAEEEAERQMAPQPQPVPEPAVVTAILSVPCWLMNNCPPERREMCPAFQERGVPCWQARKQANGALPANCPDCPRYVTGHAAA